jgi:hypothetical protein
MDRCHVWKRQVVNSNSLDSNEKQFLQEQLQKRWSTAEYPVDIIVNFGLVPKLPLPCGTTAGLKVEG